MTVGDDQQEFGHSVYPEPIVPSYCLFEQLELLSLSSQGFQLLQRSKVIPIMMHDCENCTLCFWSSECVKYVTFVDLEQKLHTSYLIEYKGVIPIG